MQLLIDNCNQNLTKELRDLKKEMKVFQLREVYNV